MLDVVHLCSGPEGGSDEQDDGTAFVVRAIDEGTGNGFAVTARHVVGACKELKLYGPDAQRNGIRECSYVAEVVDKLDTPRSVFPGDIAVLRFRLNAGETKTRCGVGNQISLLPMAPLDADSEKAYVPFRSGQGSVYAGTSRSIPFRVTSIPPASGILLTSSTQELVGKGYSGSPVLLNSPTQSVPFGAIGMLVERIPGPTDQDGASARAFGQRVVDLGLVPGELSRAVLSAVPPSSAVKTYVSSALLCEVRARPDPSTLDSFDIFYISGALSGASGCVKKEYQTFSSLLKNIYGDNGPRLPDFSAAPRGFAADQIRADFRACGPESGADRLKAADELEMYAYAVNLQLVDVGEPDATHQASVAMYNRALCLSHTSNYADLPRALVFELWKALRIQDSNIQQIETFAGIFDQLINLGNKWVDGNYYESGAVKLEWEVSSYSLHRICLLAAPRCLVKIDDVRASLRRLLEDTNNDAVLERGSIAKTVRDQIAKSGYKPLVIDSVIRSKRPSRLYTSGLEVDESLSEIVQAISDQTEVKTRSKPTIRPHAG